MTSKWFVPLLSFFFVLPSLVLADTITIAGETNGATTTFNIFEEREVAVGIESLKGTSNRYSVQVLDLPQDFSDRGITTTQIRQWTDLRLKSAGISVLYDGQSLSYLQISIKGMSLDLDFDHDNVDNLHVGFVIVATLTFKTPALLLPDIVTYPQVAALGDDGKLVEFILNTSAPLITWQRMRITTVSSDLDESIHDSINALIDDFLNDRRKANPKDSTTDVLEHKTSEFNIQSGSH